MNKLVAGTELAIKNKVEMRIHQDKRQDFDIIALQDGINAVHPGTKISLVVKNQIHGIPITVEMPTIPDWNLLSSGSNTIQAQICNNVQTPHINNCL